MRRLVSHRGAAAWRRWTRDQGGVVMRAKVLPVLMASIAAALTCAPSADATGGGFIVVLRPGASARTVAADYGTKPQFTYTAAFNGFAANIELSKASRLAADARVEFIQDDRDHLPREPM